MRVLLVLLMTIWGTQAAVSAESAQDSLSFGIVPQQAASKLARNWAPLLDYLGKASGMKLVFRTAPDIPEFERRVAAGEYDLAYMNPYHYTVFSAEPGYRAFAKAAGKRIKGILVVRKGSPLQDPGGLAGETIAFPAPAAFAASVLPRAYLVREGIDFSPKYVSSHDSVYRTVAKGLYAAGGGVVRTFESVEPDVRDELRVLWTTDGYTPHAFAAHPRVPAETMERLTEAMIRSGESDEGRALLEPLSLKGFESAADSDWDDVRALGIGLLDELVKPVR
jgi:phosphonate transport system substrate-binding protein